MFLTTSHFRPSLTFDGKAGAYPDRGPSRKGYTALNIRLGWKSLVVTNTLAYPYLVLITALKCFILKAQVAMTCDKISGAATFCQVTVSSKNSSLCYKPCYVRNL